MKAAVLTKVGGPIEMADVEIMPLQKGQVLVDVVTSGFCGAQLQEIAGEKGNAKFMPHLLGHEGYGLVREVGEGVSFVGKGDPVILHWRKGRGVESDFPKFFFDGREISSGKITTFSEQTVVSENRLSLIGRGDVEGVGKELLPLLGCSLMTGQGAVGHVGRVKKGDTVFVVGCGGVGLMAIRAARWAGAKNIVAIDFDNKCDASMRCGATIFYNPGDDLGFKADVVIDTVGECGYVAHLASGGVYVLVGQPKGDIVIKNGRSLFDSESGKSIISTQGGDISPLVSIQENISKLKEERESFLKEIRVYPLTEINEAVEDLRAGKVGRIIFDHGY